MAQADGSDGPTATTDCTQVSEIPQGECEDLMAFYSATNGDDWTHNDYWTKTNTPCSWYGVTCSSGHVTKIILDNNNLGGNLIDLPHLSALNDLWVRNNHIGGVIPDFTNLPNLWHFLASGNQLDGSIPDLHLGALLKLELSNNQLDGTLPDFAHMPALRELFLQSNQFDGAIPDFSHMPDLINLFLDHNQLSGSIPDFAHIPDLSQLILSANQLTGSVPDFSHMPSLTTLELNYNQLNGSVPDFSHIPDVTQLYLNGNHLTGSIPDFSNLPNLSYLYLDHNQLSGSIPNFAHLPDLRSLYLHANQLEGEIPGFENSPLLLTLWLQDNQLRGVVSTGPTDGICDLPVNDVNLGYNKLDIYATDACVDSLDSDWKDTQTAPPVITHMVTLSSKSIRLEWDPIPYTGDGGYYDVRWGETYGGPYDHSVHTADKTANQMTINGLTPGHTYYFIIRTFTPAHGEQQNDLTSDDSNLASVMLVAISTNGADVKLYWTPRTHVEDYQVLYSQDFYFQPDDAGVTQVAATPPWYHYGAAADVAHNYAYLVRGDLGGGDYYGPFNRVGEFTFGLTPGN